MRKGSFTKFTNYQINPDLANKFLLKNIRDIPKIDFKNIYLMYVFRQKTPYSFIAIKSILMLSSIDSKICLTKTKIIVLKYSKTQSHSVVYMSLNFYDLINILSFYYTKPAPIKKFMSSFISETKYFLFPGFIKHLRITSWKKNINLSLKGKNNQNYWLFFYKTIFFD